MDYCVYILFSHKLNKYYIGETSNIEARLAFHNDEERNKIWTRRGIPWELKAIVPCKDRSESMRIEKKIKKARNRATIERIIRKGDVSWKWRAG